MAFSSLSTKNLDGKAYLEGFVVVSHYYPSVIMGCHDLQVVKGHCLAVR